MSLWVSIHGFSNGEQIEQDVLNRPLLELKQRTDYLYNQLMAMAGDNVFETVRISGLAVETEGDNIPAVKDLVYLNPDTKKLEKAITSVNLFNNAFAAADANSLTVGMLVSVNSNATEGVVAASGKLTASSLGGSWAVTDIVESTETFRDGPYYLSAVEAGKVTASPSGPAIYIGQFFSQAANPTLLDYIILSPQYKDTAESHIHRAIKLYTQPAGTQAYSDDPITGTHTLYGFDPTDPTDAHCRLIITGSFNALESTQYTFRLAGANYADAPSSLDLFDDVYLHWTSSDPNEGTGSVQLRSYEVPVSVGTKGLLAVLENVETDEWNKVEEGVADKRTWVIEVPEQTRGWLAHKSRGYFTGQIAGVDQGYSFIVMGGPYTPDDDRISETITVKALHLYRIVYGTTNPVDGNTVTVDGTIYEFDDNSSVTSPNILVPIVSGEPDSTFENLKTAILEEGVTTVDTAINTDDHHLLIGVGDLATVSTTLGAPITLAEIVVAGPWAIDASNGLLVYDKNHDVLIATDSYWNNAEYWEPVTLKNNLKIMAIPYDSAGVAAIGDVVANSDTWYDTFINDAPTTNFVYNVAMHPDLMQAYPPIPYSSCAIVLNGIELDSYANFNDRYVYRAGLSGIYWLSNAYGRVPWPAIWESYTTEIPYEYTQNMAYHGVRMAIGNSSVVTSLQADPDSPIRIVKCGTNDAATVGDLSIALDLQLQELEANMEGYSVFKGISNNKLVKGPVVSELVAGPGVAISSPVGVPSGRGRVMVSLSSGAGLNGDFSEVVLENAKQKTVGMFPYVQLLDWTTGGTGNIDTGFTAKFKIPTFVTGNYKVLVYLTLFGETDIDEVGVAPALKYAGLEFTYSVLHDYLYPTDLNPHDNLIDDLIEPVAARQVLVPIGSVTATPVYNAYDPIIIHNNPSETTEETRRITNAMGSPFPTVDDMQGGVVIDPAKAYVTSGSLVAIRIKRAGVSNPVTEYTSKLGFINLFWRLAE